MRVVAGAGGVLNRASVPSQYLQGVGAVLNRTGNRTGERAASVPHGELVVILGPGFARGVRTGGHRRRRKHAGSSGEEPYRKRTQAYRSAPRRARKRLAPKGRDRAAGAGEVCGLFRAVRA